MDLVESMMFFNTEKKKKKTELLYLTLVIDEIYSAGAENINILVESSHIMYMIGPILQTA